MKIIDLGFKSNRMFYFLFGFFCMILLFLLLFVYKSPDRYRNAKYLQAIYPDKLPEDQRWSRSRSIRAYKDEKKRRKMMGQGIYA